MKSFLSAEYDEWWTRLWLGHLSAEEEKAFEKLLLEDPQFREEFCDWIRELRKLEGAPS